MKHETAIKNELEMLSDSDKERFERIRVAQIEKYGSEKPEQLQSALHTIRRVSYQRLESESLKEGNFAQLRSCLLYTSDAADDLLCVDLGGRRIIKKKKKSQ